MNSIHYTSKVALVGFCLAFANGVNLANANILANPDLDTIAIGSQVLATPVSWQVVASKTVSGPFFDGASSEMFCNVQQPNGYGLFFKPFQGNATLGDYINVQFYQDNPASAGMSFTLSGYAACEPNFCGLLPAPPGGTVPLALFEVQFLNGALVLQDNTYNLVANGMPTTGPGAMALMSTPQYTAPAGTTTIRVGATLVNGYSTTGPQSFFVDAFDLESVPEPGTLALLGLGIVPLLWRRRRI